MQGLSNLVENVICCQPQIHTVFFFLFTRCSVAMACNKHTTHVWHTLARLDGSVKKETSPALKSLVLKFCLTCDQSDRCLVENKVEDLATWSAGKLNSIQHFRTDFRFAILFRLWPAGRHVPRLDVNIQLAFVITTVLR